MILVSCVGSLGICQLTVGSLSRPQDQPPLDPSKLSTIAIRYENRRQGSSQVRAGERQRADHG